MEQLQKVESNSIQVSDMVKTIISDATVEIDNYIEKVRQCFLSEKDIPDGDLDKIILQIPIYVYYLTNVLQQLDVKKGIASEQAKYYENEALLNATGTVAEKQAKSENATVKDRMTQLAYKSAVSIIQGKINGAMEILSSAKKVQQRRLLEMQLTKAAGSSVGAF